MKNILWVLVLLVSTAYATNIDTDFWDLPNELDTHFRTDMQVTTDFTLSLVSGDVASGDPDDLEGGDVVYEGAVLEVDPSVNAIWARSSLDLVSVYPTCAATGYCPAMIDYTGGMNTNRNVKWLGTELFDEHKSFGDLNPFSQNTARHDELDTFYNQPVTYTNVSNVYHSNKRGGANIFCKGTLEVVDNGVVVGYSELPDMGPVEFTVTGDGSHDIETRIADAECFAAIEKHPLDLPTHPEYFYFFYFTYNAPPIPDAIATEVTTITINPSDGCEMHETAISASLDVDDLAIVKVTLHNDGALATLTEVRSSNPDYPAEPLPITMCEQGIIPSQLCPPAGETNGFDEPISRGSEKDLYVLITRLPGGTGGTILTFMAQTDVCDDVDLTGPISCEIEPPSLEFVTKEVAEFLVTCYDLSDTRIPCEGDNWYWNDGLVGGFVEKDSSHSLAYSTSTAGSSGTLNYNSSAAHCSSDVDVRPADAIARPTYECDLAPSRAALRQSTTKDFTLNGFEGGNPSEPRDAQYHLIDGLTGSTSNPSTQGVTYEAPASDTTGKLRAYGEWRDPTPDNPVTGSVCFSSISVGATNITDGEEGEGASEWCDIDGEGSVYPGYYGWVTIKCGPPPLRNESCSGVGWDISAEGYIHPPSNDDGTYWGVDELAAYGNKGYIYAWVDGDEAKSCYLPFFVWDRYCWEFS